MVRVIINSDDFGYNVKTNEAIAAAFRLGLISSTTMLANFEQGLADGIQKIHAGNIPANAVGIHFNLTEGIPLSQRIKDLPRFVNPKGRFCFKRSELRFLSRAEKAAVHEELEMQLNAITSKGISLTHFDSHHHVHTEPAVLPIALAVAKKHGIRKVRLSRNIGRMNPLKRVAKNAFNVLIRWKGFHTTRHFGDVADIQAMPPAVGIETSLEVMVHAIYNKSDILSDLDGKPLIQNLEVLRSFLYSTGYPFTFTSYKEI